MKLISSKQNNIIQPYIIAIPTYKRNTILFNRTLNTLFNCNINSKYIYLFLASKTEYNLYLKNYDNLESKKYKQWCSKLKCVIGVKGLKNQRNFIAKYFCEGQNIIQMDDDIQNFYYLKYNKSEPKNRKYWSLASYTNNNINTISNKLNFKISNKLNLKNSNKINAKNSNKINKTKKNKFTKSKSKQSLLDTLFKDTFKKCKRENIYLWGIYPVENAYFMQPYATTDLRFIVGPCFGIINRHDSRLKLTLDEKENVERTLQYWSLDGKVLRLNNITLRTQYYKTPGGMQSEGKIRKEEAMKSAQILHKKYPNLTKIYLGKKSGHPEIKLINKQSKNI